jgi:hypothetical protein
VLITREPSFSVNPITTCFCQASKNPPPLF